MNKKTKYKTEADDVFGMWTDLKELESVDDYTNNLWKGRFENIEKCRKAGRS